MVKKICFQCQTTMPVIEGQTEIYCPNCGLTSCFTNLVCTNHEIERMHDSDRGIYVCPWCIQP